MTPRTQLQILHNQFGVQNAEGVRTHFWNLIPQGGWGGQGDFVKISNVFQKLQWSAAALTDKRVRLRFLATLAREVVGSHFVHLAINWPTAYATADAGGRYNFGVTKDMVDTDTVNVEVTPAFTDKVVITHDKEEVVETDKTGYEVFIPKWSIDIWSDHYPGEFMIDVVLGNKDFGMKLATTLDYESETSSNLIPSNSIIAQMLLVPGPRPVFEEATIDDIPVVVETIESPTFPCDTETLTRCRRKSWFKRLLTRCRKAEH